MGEREAAAVLGITLEIMTPEILRRRYQEAMKECHPDRHPLAEKEKWTKLTRSIMDANEVLKNRKSDVYQKDLEFLDRLAYKEQKQMNKDRKAKLQLAESRRKHAEYTSSMEQKREQIKQERRKAELAKLEQEMTALSEAEQARMRASAST